MFYEEFSIKKLEEKLEAIESSEEKIKFVSDEILRCKKAIQDIHNQARNADQVEIKISTKTKILRIPISEVFNFDKHIKYVMARKAIKLCCENICEECNKYLERAMVHLEHLQTVQTINNNQVAMKEENITLSKKIMTVPIIWRSGKEKLIALFDALFQNEILPKYSNEEILSHFADEKQIVFSNALPRYKKFLWKDSDCRFAILIDELAKKGIIDDESKYKCFAEHFVNRKNGQFKNLAQKRSYTENFTKSGNLIREILKSAGLLIEILFLLPTNII